MDILTILTAVDQVKFMDWSSDSRLILAGMPSRNKVQVFDITNDKWRCMIDSGVLGVEWATFSPDGRHIIAASECNYNYTVCSLVDKSVKDRVRFELNAKNRTIFIFAHEKIKILRQSNFKLRDKP